jgi:AcrR family transcriptional regulator
MTKANEIAKKNPRQIREPVQLRSISMKEKLVEAALELFCEKGYYKTTTNEIARRANVSIGSLYAYFKDKDTLFIEVLNKYHEKFSAAKSAVLENTDLMKAENSTWLRELILSLIRVHEETKELNRELIVVSFYNPQIARILEENRTKTMQTTIGYFLEHTPDISIADVEAAAMVTFDLISATVDRIVFEKNVIDRERLIDSVIDIIRKYWIPDQK